MCSNVLPFVRRVINLVFIECTLDSSPTLSLFSAKSDLVTSFDIGTPSPNHFTLFFSRHIHPPGVFVPCLFFFPLSFFRILRVVLRGSSVAAPPAIPCWCITPPAPHPLMGCAFFFFIFLICYCAALSLALG